MSVHEFTRYEDASATLRHKDLRQSLYDAGAVIMDGVLLTLHGEEHRLRRTLEFRVFRRDFFHHYETEVFPRTLAETLAPFLEQGRCDLLDFAFRVTMNLTADFAGIDRPKRSTDETERLLRLVKTFAEGATLVHSTRDKAEVEREVRAALLELDEAFLRPSVARRQALLARGEEMPRDVLGVLLRNEDRVNLTPEMLLREMAFYLQAGSHSTGNSTAHAFHDLVEWLAANEEDEARLEADPFFLQRCVFESFRLHPASPVAWRRPVCPVTLANGAHADTADEIVVDLHMANREPEIFGTDADRFNPHRAIRHPVPPFGLTFGTGVHLCLGRDLDGGVVPNADTDPATHQYGIVARLLAELRVRGAKPDPDRAPTRAEHTARPNWGSYPIVFKP